MNFIKLALTMALMAAPHLAQAAPQAPTRMAAKVQPDRAAAQLRRQLGLQSRDTGPQGASVYGECYPSSGEGGEDCTVFLAICAGAKGGASSLPGGGYGCQVNK